MNVIINPIAYNSSDGISFEIYIPGCLREEKCKDCHNPELWDFNKGVELNYNELNEIIDIYYEKFDNFAILGGEPLHQNIFELVPLFRFLY